MNVAVCVKSTCALCDDGCVTNVGLTTNNEKLTINKEVQTILLGEQTTLNFLGAWQFYE